MRLGLLDFRPKLELEVRVSRRMPWRECTKHMPSLLLFPCRAKGKASNTSRQTRAAQSRDNESRPPVGIQSADRCSGVADLNYFKDIPPSVYTIARPARPLDDKIGVLMNVEEEDHLRLRQNAAKDSEVRHESAAHVCDMLNYVNVLMARFASSGSRLLPRALHAPSPEQCTKALP